MLKIIKNPKKRPPKLTEFTAPFSNQKLGIELTICLNVNSLNVLTAPECGINQNAMVTKQKPGVYFNPKIINPSKLPESFTCSEEDNTICIKYANYLGEESYCCLTDSDGSILGAINRLNGKKEQEIEQHAN